MATCRVAVSSRARWGRSSGRVRLSLLTYLLTWQPVLSLRHRWSWASQFVSGSSPSFGLGGDGRTDGDARRQQRNSRRGTKSVANQRQRIGFLRLGAPLVSSSIRASSEARVAEYVQDLFAHSRSGLRHETRLEAWNAQATLYKCCLQFRHGERSYVALPQHGLDCHKPFGGVVLVLEGCAPLGPSASYWPNS